MNKKKLSLLFLFSTLISFSIFILRSRSFFPKDWGQFAYYTRFIQASIWQFGKFPIHNPWFCGGIDYLANPQNRLFSPLVLYEIFLPPQLAQLCILMTLSFLGLWGTYAFLRSFQIKESSSIVGAILFINCNWFAFHFTEGHGPFSSFQLIPLMLFLGRYILERRNFLAFTSILAFMLVSGEIYPFSFTFLIFANAMLIGWVSFVGWQALLRRNAWFYLLTILCFILLTLPKTYPTLMFLSHRNPDLDFFTMPNNLLRRAFFNPFEHIFTMFSALRFHEYACYLSPLGIALVIFTMIKSKGFFRTNILAFLSVLFWLWVGSGLLPKINPWHLYQKLPIFNNMHAQSRLFIFSYVFFVFLISKSLDTFIARKWVYSILACFLLAEAYTVYIYPTLDVGRNRNDYGMHPGIMGTNELKIFSTTPVAINNSQSNICYEHSFTNGPILQPRDPKYKGAIYTVPNHHGFAHEFAYTPGYLNFSYSIPKGALLELNTNALFGWKIKKGEGEILTHGSDLLKIKPKYPIGEMELEYAPGYVPGVVASYFLGMILWLLLSSVVCKRKSAISDGHLQSGNE